MTAVTEEAPANVVVEFCVDDTKENLSEKNNIFYEGSEVTSSCATVGEAMMQWIRDIRGTSEIPDLIRVFSGLLTQYFDIVSFSVFSLSRLEEQTKLCLLNTKVLGDDSDNLGQPMLNLLDQTLISVLEEELSHCLCRKSHVPSGGRHLDSYDRMGAENTADITNSSVGTPIDPAIDPAVDPAVDKTLARSIGRLEVDGRLVNFCWLGINQGNHPQFDSSSINQINIRKSCASQSNPTPKQNSPLGNLPFNYSSEPLICAWEVESSKSANFSKSDIGALYALVNFDFHWKVRLEEAQRKQHRDELTQLYNYQYLMDELDSELRRADRFSSKFSLIFIDLDEFKSVNDRFGHLIGSSVLQQVAAVFTHLLREVDTIFRYGGDEFVVMLLGADAAAARHVAERIRQAVGNYKFSVEAQDSFDNLDEMDKENNAWIKLTVSVGVSTYPTHAKSREALLSLADKSMYRGKSQGRNCVVMA